jgi:anaerobic sulfite reductase subunit A
VIEKDMVIFLRSCDLHAVRRLDEIYLRNGLPDFYYQRLREKVQFVLIGCPAAFDSCFCVDMGTNRSDNYDAAFELRGGQVYMAARHPQWEALLRQYGEPVEGFAPSYVTETPTRVSIPADLSPAVAKSTVWDEYDKRCIGCGRCNYACPTCTCFTMQDIYYTDNAKAGERRRVAASCMVDGFTDVAGGGSYRKKHGERMRFKVLHKVYDFKQRNGYQMCVGCGRCDDVCPEYISFSAILNKLEEAMQEVRGDGQQ